MQDSSNEILKVLFLGDVIGQPGGRAIFLNLSNIIKKYNIDWTIVNGENAYEGFGITPDIADNFFSYGVDIITTGNHIWQNSKIFPYLDIRKDILRPANYSSSMAGNGYFISEKKGKKLAVLNLIGRHQLAITDCPFKVGLKLVREISATTKNILIDFHAELAEEKQALCHFLDEKVSAVIGTHTHLQTADEKITSKGTAYITDVGMCGPKNSIIGGDIDISIERFLTQVPKKIAIADGPEVLSGVVIEIENETGKSKSIERINIFSE